LSLYKGFDKIIIAEDGVQAMQKLSNQEFDLVITDLVMPKRDGFKLIENIKKVPKYYKVKFMIVSGCLSKEATVNAMRKGIRHIVVKPFTARQILEAVFDVLKVDKDPRALADKLILKVAERLKEVRELKENEMQREQIERLKKIKTDE
jgi:YesN/AraC family two-component response regulator